MAEARFRFHDALNDFLTPERQRVAFPHVFDRRASIKDMVEALGVPHPEIGRLTVNGQPVDFGYIVRDGDRIDVHPIADASDVPGRRTGQRIRFALDANLGALARYLRLCGFDTRYRNDIDDGELAALAATDERVLLTRDRDVLKRRIVTHGYFVRADNPRDQLGEVVRRFDLAGSARPFTRCSRCNGVLEDVDKAVIAHRLKPLTRRYYDTFRRCTGCDRIYWRGTHVQGIEALVGCTRAHDDDACTPLTGARRPGRRETKKTGRIVRIPSLGRTGLTETTSRRRGLRRSSGVHNESPGHSESRSS